MKFGFGRSVRLRIIGLYMLILALAYVLFGIYTYKSCEDYLIRALRESLFRRAGQIATSLVNEIPQRGEAYLGREIEARYAPELNERVIRVSDSKGRAIYLSQNANAMAPCSTGPALKSAIPAAAFLGGIEASTDDRTEDLTYQNEAVNFKDSKIGNLGEFETIELMHTLPNGSSYIIEVGAPLVGIRDALWNFFLALLLAFPIIAGLAVGAGLILLGRALKPIDEIVTAAELITIKNLTQRLPVSSSGDEFERMSRAMNRMIERLHDACQLTLRFTADASHELRTPLTVIRDELDHLRRDIKQNPDSIERIGSVMEEVERMTQIIEGLLLMSRLEAGETQLTREAVDLGELIQETTEQMALMAFDKRIEVQLKTPHRVLVAIDEIRLRQAVANLLDNAIKYTPEGGKVTLQVGTEEGQGFVLVEDTGIGISKGALPRIFDRFYRADAVRKPDFRGTGLGLSIVESIVHAHAGSIRVSSQEGKGSQFKILLPLLLDGDADRTLDPNLKSESERAKLESDFEPFFYQRILPIQKRGNHK